MISVLTALAEYPERVQKLFRTKELNQEGIIAMNIFSKGRPEVVTIDDRLPYGSTTSLFLRPTADQAYWAHMAEKVFAKINANYEMIGWGWMNEAFYTFTGVPSVMMKPSSLTTDELWDVMVDADEKKFIFTAACMRAKLGVVGGHAYTVMGVQPIYSEAGELVERLVLVRNPWGKVEFIGDWSDSSKKWSTFNKRQVPTHTFSGLDGLFYMSISDFQTIFSYVTITYYHDDWQLSFYE